MEASGARVTLASYSQARSRAPFLDIKAQRKHGHEFVGRIEDNSLNSGSVMRNLIPTVTIRSAIPNRFHSQTRCAGVCGSWNAVDVTTRACNPTVSSPARLEACRGIKYQERSRREHDNAGTATSPHCPSKLSTGKQQRSPRGLCRRGTRNRCSIINGGYRRGSAS